MGKKSLMLLLGSALFFGGCSSDNQGELCTESVCDGNTAKVCWNGEVVPTECPLGCMNGVCLKKGQICIDGASRCSDQGIPQTCSENAWHDGDPCETGNTCVSGKCYSSGIVSSKVCEDDAVRCSGDGVPQKCVNGVWVFQKSCEKTEICQDGGCVLNKCGQIFCEPTQTCLSGVCVPTWQLSVKDGTECDPDTWVDYCSADNKAVSCATTKGVYRDSCSKDNPCVVADFTEKMGYPWYPAFCNSSYADRCAEVEDLTKEIPYCELFTNSLNPFYYQSTIQCAKTFEGGYLALDFSVYGYYNSCNGYACDSTGTVCGSSTECDFKDHCEGETLVSCNNGEKDTMNCTEFDAVCRTFTYSRGYYSNCFDEGDRCNELHAKKTSCSNVNKAGYETRYECLKADGDESGQLYWAVTSKKKCDVGCDGSACEGE